jgi:CBS domain containing-hemolysin-like protein
MSTAWFFVIAIILELAAVLVVLMRTAIATVSHGRAQELAREGSASGKRLSALLDDRAKYVASLQLLYWLLAGFAATFAAIGFTHLVSNSAWAIVVAGLVIGLVGFVVLGVGPETYGQQRALVIATRTAGLAKFLGSVLWPFAKLFVLVGNAITPGKGYRAGPFASEEDLRELVDLAERDHVIDDDERQMIHSVFELGDTFAREVMVPRTEMVWIESDKSLRQAMSLSLRSGYSRIPVVDDDPDDIVGVVYAKDIARRLFDRRESGADEPVSKHMREAHFVPDSKPADELLRDMQAGHVHLAVVVDEYGGTAGIVTIEDILEEIVGEIADEHDTATPEVTTREDGCYELSARMHIDDAAELLEADVNGDDEEVGTLLGYMAKKLGRVPIEGSTVEFGNWTLEAQNGANRRNRIGIIVAVPHATAEPTDADSAVGTAAKSDAANS